LQYILIYVLNELISYSFKGIRFCGILCKCWNQFRLYSCILSSMPVICSSRQMQLWRGIGSKGPILDDDDDDDDFLQLFTLALKIHIP